MRAPGLTRRSGRPPLSLPHPPPSPPPSLPPDGGDHREQGSKELVEALKEAYKTLREEGKAFEVVLVCQDTNDDSYTRFFGA